MTKIGLTSVTFRQKSISEIILLAKKLDLDGIEWGSDVHVAAGDEKAISEVLALSALHNIEIFSYGTYYKLQQDLSIQDDFLPLLQTAVTLGAKTLRIWAGRLASAEAEDEYYHKAAAELRELCQLAIEYEVNIGLEYHRKSLTDNSRSALKLLDLTSCVNLSLYWQPNPELSVGENQQEIRDILPFLSNVHVFYWQNDNTRLALAAGEYDWGKYIELLGERNYLFEFVADDSSENLMQDVVTLRRLLAATK